MISHKKTIAGIMAVVSILAMNYSIPFTSFLDNSVVLTANAGTAADFAWDIDADGTMRISGTGEMPYEINAKSVKWDLRRSEIKKVIIEKGITSISPYSFSNCPNLESVSIPDTVTIIQNSAFFNDTKLTSISIPSSVKEIWSRAFSNTGCTEIVFPNSVTEMDGAIVADSTKLQKVVLPDSIKSIGAVMFSGCSNLTDVNIPASVEKIEYYAFSGCTALTSIDLPDGLKEIDYNAFEFCSGLKNIVIPESVTQIGDCAYQGCSSVESLKISNPAATVGHGAFSECPKLTTLDIPDGISFADNAFVGDAAIQNAPFDYLVYEGRDHGKNSSDYINWKITSDGVLTLSGNCEMRDQERTASFTCGWANYRNMVKKIVIGEGITSTGVRAFEYFDNLETVVLPSTITKINLNSFAHDPKLKNINFPEGLTSIGNFAFYGATSLDTIELPSTLTSLGEASFYCCYPLKELNIPEGVTEIPKDCFAGANALEKLTLPDGLKTIGFQAFFACGMEEVSIPDSVTKIDDNAFIDCYNLKYALLSSDSQLTYLGASAFNGCESLKGFGMPDGVTVLKDSTFAQCPNLSEFTLSKNIETIESGAFTGCSSLKELYIPTSLKTIEKNIFYSTKNLNKIIYCGTKAQWDNIIIGENNGKFHEYPQFHDYHYDVCSYCGAKNPYTNTRFEGYSINIDGSIGVNVYMTLDDAILADEQASINFIMPDNKVVNAPVSAAEKTTVNGKDCYVFSSHVATKDMFSPITAQVTLGDKSKVASLSFTVSNYITALRNTQPEYEEFANAFINYGRFASCYFNESGDYPKEYTEEDYQKVLAKITPSAGITAPDYYGTSLLLKTNTVLRHYFTENAPGRQIKLPSTEGGQTYYYVEQEFCPADYDKKIDGYDYCIYDYIYKGLSSDNTDIALKNLCTALYEYAEACKKIA